MYQQVETHKTATLQNGNEFTPIATLKDEYGGIAHWGIDDRCYVLYLVRDGRCVPAKHIFPEAFEVLKTLLSPTEEALLEGQPLQGG